jgi:WD40 repeat protein
MAISCENSVWLREREGDAWRAVTRSPTSLGLSELALDGRGHLVVGHGDGVLRIWDLSPSATADRAAAPGASDAPGNLLVTQRRHAARISILEVRGDTAFSFSQDQTLRQWAIPSGAPRERAYVRYDFSAMSPSGRWIATVDGSPAVSLWDSARGRLLVQLPTGEPLSSVVFLDEDRVVVGGKTGRLEILDVSGRQRGPERTAADVIRLVGDAPRWRVVNGRVVERE